MEKIVKTGQVNGRVKAIASKSQAHRYLICAALSDKEMEVHFEEDSEDIIATMECLKSMGAEIERTEYGCKVTPILYSGDFVLMKCNESGSTFRFLLPVAGALGIQGAFELKGRLAKRPLSPLYEEMIRHGCKMSEQGTTPFDIAGGLTGGEYVIPANVSSQFISGLLFALPLLEEDSTIQLTGKIESKSYIDMTLDAISKFGIKIESTYNNEGELIFCIKGGQSYSLDDADVVNVEGDWSNAAFILCAGAIAGKVDCYGLDINSRQGDKEIVNILTKFGSAVNVSNDGDDKYTINIEKNDIKGIEINAENIPDLVPVLAAVASVAKGTTRIYNAQRLRLKESDRLETVSTTLNKLGADITVTEDGLIINGKDRLIGGVVDSCGDHRIAMMAAVASLVCDEEVTITNAEAINKSYPGFFEDFACITM